MRLPFRCVAAYFILATVGFGVDAPTLHGRVKSLKVTILSTMLADLPGGNLVLGEWGFAALVEADGHRILFDTGSHEEVVLRNAEAMKIDLSNVPEVVLSHSHWDHVSGFLTLRRSVAEKTPGALARTHVGEGIFYPRLFHGSPDNPALLLKPEYEKTGGVFIIHAQPAEIYPGIWVTGPVPRKYPEHNWSNDGTVIVGPKGTTQDNLPEDMSLVFDTDQGLVVLTGCAHAGIINIIEHARNIVRPARIHAVIGGTHLFNASDATMQWTGDRLREFGVDYLLGGHCTGIETVYRLRHDLALDRSHAVVAAVGSRFELGRGIEPGAIAR